MFFRRSSIASSSPIRARARSSTSTTAIYSTRLSGRRNRIACSPASRRTSSPTRKSCASLGLLDEHALGSRAQTAGDGHVLLRHPVILREKFHQRFVRAPFVRRRRETDLESLAVLSGEFRPLRTRLHVQLEHDPHQTLARTISTIWIRIS